MSEVSARIGGKKGTRATASYNFGKNLDEAVKIFGAELVFHKFEAAGVIDLQAYMRRVMANNVTEKKEPNAGLTEAVKAWKPGMRAPAKTRKEKMLSDWDKLSPEEKAELRKYFKG